MTRLGRIAVIVLALAAGLAGAPARAQAPMFPGGGAAGLVPPPGLVPAAGFTGFEEPTRSATILIAEMPLEAFAAFERELTDGALAGQGIAVETREPLTLAGDVPAFLITGTQTAGGTRLRKWVLAARGPATTALVSAQVAPAGTAAYPDAAMRAALLSLVFKPPLPMAEQLAALPFAINDFAGFRPVRVLSGNAIYLTDGPKDVIPGAEQPVVVIARSFGGAPETRDIDAFARRALGSLPNVAKMRIERAEPQRVRGAPGHEIRADASDANSDAPIKVVQWLRVERGGYLRLVAFVPTDRFEAVFPRLRAIRDGLELR